MTQRPSSLAENSLQNFAILIVTGAVSAVTAIVVGRSLHPSSVGRVTLGAAVATLGSGVLMLGLAPAITRVVAERGDERSKVAGVTHYVVRQWAFGTSIGALATASMLMLGVTVTGALATDVIAASGAAAAAFGNGVAAVAAGLRNFRVLLRVALIAQPVTLAATFAAAAWRPTPTSFILAQLAGFLVNASALALFARRFRGAPRNEVHEVATEIRRQRRQLAQLAAVDLVVFQRSEVVLLGIVSSRAEVAFYGLAYNLVSQAMSRLPGALSGVLLPEMASSDEKARASTFRTATTTIAALSAAIVIPAVSIANDGAEVLFGGEFRRVGDIIRILIIGAAATALSSPGSALLLAADQQRIVKRLGFALAVIDITLAASLASLLGGVGAAIASSTAQLVGLVLGFRIVTRQTGMRWPSEVWTVLVVAGSASVVAAIGARTLDAPVHSVLFGAVVTVCAVASLGVHFRCDRDQCVRCAVLPRSGRLKL